MCARARLCVLCVCARAFVFTRFSESPLPLSPLSHTHTHDAAKLPLDGNVALGDHRKVLTVNHVFEILLKFQVLHRELYT